MFPKESFTGQDKKLAKSHWAEFSKYLDFQNQQGTIPRNLAHLPEIKSMFKLTLQDIALGWFETESPNWLTEDQMKQSFLKRFNPLGDTRRKQQDAWNKLKFDMTKDDVDSFIVDMKTLASILGHNDNVTMEKFKDVFPNPNIEAALIAMDNFPAMQTKAKQLIHIYKPAHDSPMASAAILVHTEDNTPTKGKSSQPKSLQHQLAPIYQPHNSPNTGDSDYRGDNAAEDGDMIEVLVAVENEETPITGMITRNAELAAVKDNKTFSIIEGVDKKTHIEVDADSGMEMTLITMIEIIGIEITIVKVTLKGEEDGIIIREVKHIVIVEEGEDGIPVHNIMIQGISRNPSFQIQIIIIHHQWDINTDTQSHIANIPIPSNNNNINHKGQHHHNKLQIFVSCVIAKAIMIINANLQAILWPVYKKPLIKADHTVIKTLTKGKGNKGKMITMTLMGNLFSSGGSRCH